MGGGAYKRQFILFFFSGAPGHGPRSAMVSAMARRHQYLTEPECNGSAEQRLKEGTPVVYAKIAQEPNLAPRKRSPPNGAPEQSGCARTAIR